MYEKILKLLKMLLGIREDFVNKTNKFIAKMDARDALRKKAKERLRTK